MSSQDDEAKAATDAKSAEAKAAAKAAKAAEANSESAPKAVGSSNPKPKFFLIRMSSKRKDDDPDAIDISAQGKVPRLFRFNEECVCDETEKCILDSSEITIYKTRITGNKAVLVPTGKRRLYEYSLIKEISYEEYKAGKASSQKIAAGEIVQMQRAAEMDAIARGEG